jgi:signal transduction histidine kinase
METRRNVFLICKEALNNVVRHSHATEVTIVIRLEEKDLRMGIHDNGCGFDQGQLSSGNGLPNLYHRASKIGGELHIESSTGHGTCIYLQCPLA